MSKTKQGAFNTTYHHIEAPTIQDKEYGKEFHKRKLMVPRADVLSYETYLNPLLSYLSNLPWRYTRKLDGENIRIQWDGEQALWNGKTDKFQCSAEFTDYMNKTFLEEIFEEKFGRGRIVTLFGEKMGPKTQGNELDLEKDELILYDVNIDGTWLPKDAVREIADYFEVRAATDFTPLTYAGASLRGLIELCAAGKFKDWEGIVATPLVECRYQNGKRVIVKIKNRDYLREE